MNRILKQNLSFRVRKIAKQNVLFGEGLKAYNLNETGEFIWNQINGKKSLQDIYNELAENYENTNEREIQNDLCRFVDFLLSIGAVFEIVK